MSQSSDRTDALKAVNAEAICYTSPPQTPGRNSVENQSLISSRPLTPPFDTPDVKRADISNTKPLGSPIWAMSGGHTNKTFIIDNTPESNHQRMSDGPAARNDIEADSTLKYTSSDFKACFAQDQELYDLFMKWLGTSVNHETETGALPSKDELCNLISQRSEAENQAKKRPYDPLQWLQLAAVYFDLCYSDLQVSIAHKSLLLISYGLDPIEKTLGKAVRLAVATRLSCSSVIVVTHELEYLRLEALKTLIRGLYDSGANWDGLKEVKKALKLFPANEDLKTLQDMLKKEHRYVQECVKGMKGTSEEKKHLLHIGKTHKRQYPWLDNELFIRTPALLNIFNAEFRSASCEIRQVRFGDYTPELENGKDIGGLGVFARRDIRKDEILLVDYNLTLVSNIPPFKLSICDACHASLHPIFLSSSEVRVAQCCKAVAYCSDECHAAAMNSYHRVLCGKDFAWVYKSATGTSDNASWRPVVMLRLLAIIISDIQALPKGKQIHPLQHPLIARLTAGYVTGDETDQEWNYFSHVITPNRILMQLGIDIFTSSEWSAEVVHTIWWRMVNNACKTTSLFVQEDGDKVKVEPYVITGISPGYIFFNHSCDPSVGWIAAGGPEGMGRGGWVEKERKKGKDGGIGKRSIILGCNAMLCIATRDIKKDEEARISYCPRDQRGHLKKWFEGGCGCVECEKEKERGERNSMEGREKENRGGT